MVAPRPADRLPDAGRRRGQAGILYAVDNGAILFGFDLATGKHAVGQEARHAAEGLAGPRRRQALRRHRERQVLHPQAVARPASRCSTKTRCRSRIQEGTGGAEPGPEPIVASPAVANGRVYVASMDALYAIGPKALKAGAAAAPPRRPRRRPPAPPVAADHRARLPVRRHAEAGPGAEVHRQPVRRQRQSGADAGRRARSPGRSKG